MTSARGQLAAGLARLADVTVLAEEPLARHTSFGIGGPAEALVLPHGAQALSAVMAWLAVGGQRPLLLGNGTNLLVSDAGVRGVVVKLAGGLRGMELRSERLVAAAGEALAAVGDRAAQAGLSGLEYIAGIPGTVGGAVIMNAGAFDAEIAQVVEWAEVVDPQGQFRRLGREDLDFGYRRCALRDAGSALSRVGLRLVPGDPASIHRRMCETLERRCAKQPVAQRSADCIFKRPPGDYAGRLVEAVQGKGLRVGGAEVSPKHANFIVNTGGATAHDVLELIRLVQHRVREEFGVELEPEICLVGEPDRP